jgi:hypothetical protein
MNAHREKCKTLLHGNLLALRLPEIAAIDEPPMLDGKAA